MATSANKTPRKAQGDFHKLDEKELKSRLSVDFGKGLSESEAQERLAKYGPNDLEEEEKESFWDKIKEQFEDRMVRLLLLAAVISFVVSISSKILI